MHSPTEIYPPLKSPHRIQVYRASLLSHGLPTLPTLLSLPSLLIRPQKEINSRRFKKLHGPKSFIEDPEKFYAGIKWSRTTASGSPGQFWGTTALPRLHPGYIPRRPLIPG